VNGTLPALEPVTRIAKYEVGRKLGQGGFGEIYVARDTELDRDIAIKVLRDEHTRRPPLVQRFLQEARAAARINHPSIVTVFECGQTDAGIVFIAMELLGGETLATRIKRDYLALPDAIAVTRQVASALVAAHAAGIIHRDLKPQNVFLVPDPAAVGGVRVKILDFGIAKLTEANTSSVQTQSMELMGTPLYMSPEQCKSTATVDARSDIYALGCMLFELLAGRTPFEGDPGELIAKHQLVPPQQLRELVTGVPPQLEQLVAAMLAKAPGDRPQTMTAVLEALETVPADGALVRNAPPPSAVGFAPTLASGGTLTDPNAARAAPTVPLKPTPAAPTPARARRWWLAVVAVACVAFGIVGVAVGTHKKQAPVITEPPPVPPVPPEPPTHEGDDDDDDDVGPRTALNKHDIADLYDLTDPCLKILDGAIDAFVHGDKGAMSAAAFPLGSCESSRPKRGKDAAHDGCKVALLAGKAAEARGDHSGAFARLAFAYTCKPDPKTLALAIGAACNAGDEDDVRELWPKLDKHAKTKLAPLCAKHGVNVE
jgi:tRNA A-37 threonylcarbamoyl transferase component Bud32